ncbi:MAG: DUF2071 domain-containing protein [Saprospiraceae bacterium]|nr:DUF2071 domain-containing protein [Saprospiraceae bacterium]
MANHLFLKQTDHRPWPMPTGNWTYYQEWNRAIFMHWQLPMNELQKFVPSGLTLDDHDGKCYISLVAFTMENIHPRYLPAVPLVSNFHEINLRTYVIRDGKAGVYFLSIEAEKLLSVCLARVLSCLPYRKALLKRDGHTYGSHNKTLSQNLHLEYVPGKPLTTKSDLDQWLTERYCLYLEKNKKIYRYDIHHETWSLREVTLPRLDLQYKVGNFILSPTTLQTCHYADGVQVVSWPRVLVDG